MERVSKHLAGREERIRSLRSLLPSALSAEAFSPAAIGSR